MLEKMQKKFTRMLPGKEHFSSKERLDRLGLFTLEPRKLRALCKKLKAINR